MNDVLYSPESEIKVISALLYQPTLFFEMEDRLSASLFGDPDARRVFECLEEYVAVNNATPDPSTVAKVLTRVNNDRETSYNLLERFLVNPCYFDVEEDVAFLRELATRRETITAARSLIAQLENINTDLGDVIEEARKNIDKAERHVIDKSDDLKTLHDAFLELCRRIDDNAAGKQQKGSITGFREIDQRGGLIPGHLIIIAGRTSQGKSALATEITVSAVKNGDKVPYYTMEMTAEEEAARILASMTGIPTSKILNQKLEDDEIAEVSRAMGRINGKLMYFDESAGSTPDGIIRSIRELHRKHGIKGAVIDFLQRLNFSGPNREHATAEAVKKFKNVAKELGIWIVVLSQITRGNDEKQPPTLSGLRDSGQIEEAADEVWLIHRPEAYGPEAKFEAPWNSEPTQGKALIKIAKGRNTGTGAFICGFKAETCSFYELPQEIYRRNRQVDWEDPFK